MSLKLNLAPGESLLIGRARVQNSGDRKCTLMISGDEIVLRESRIMLEKDATTPAKRLYFVVQGIYVADNKEELFPLYHEVARGVVSAWPTLTLAVTEVSEMILGGRYYDAVNRAYAVIQMEKELLPPSAGRHDHGDNGISEG